MNEYEHLLQLILDVGVEMIRCGAETHRVEDCLYRLCSGYGFRQCNIWVIPSNIQASVLTPNENCLTQVRHIRGCGIDFSRLDALNALSCQACAEHLSSSDFGHRLSKITESASQKNGASIWEECLRAAVLVSFLTVIWQTPWLHRSFHCSLHF